MRILIENYRGWEIYFDTESEGFYTISNEYDKDQKKPSYASSKKYIDDYIKENNVFKPIKVQKMVSIWSDGGTITLIGIRKDNAFMYENKKGEKRQLSIYDVRDYFLCNSDNDPIFAKILDLQNKVKGIEKEIKALESTVIKVDLKQIRKNLLGE
jgi:hypothetical protein